jgi:hypothetical protein
MELDVILTNKTKKLIKSTKTNNKIQILLVFLLFKEDDYEK